ncbi:MAG: transposase [Candidatus Heimdallarchaeota archaeon]|nr:transposase [Candidatus Heimdallarchaeota archaeon]MCK4254334.1 transposase [Candidatus Heimdallarchaeota archaeon]
MAILQKFDPQVVKQFIEINKDLVRRKFPEKGTVDRRKGGAPRIGERWIIVLLCVIGRIEGVPWRTLPLKLSLCEFLVREGYLRVIPSKSTFHRVWQDIRVGSLESWVRTIGYNTAVKGEDAECAVDSSGFKITTGNLWRYLKWAKGQLKKTSKLFRKVHIIISLPSRTVVSITTSPSTTHDSKVCGKLFQTLPKRLIKRFKRIHLDGAYWDENIMGWIKQEGMYPDVPPNKNSVDHGTDSPQDLRVRAEKNYPGLYRKNHHPERRASVEHVFGLIKLRPLTISDRKTNNKLKTLLCPFLWYNFLLYAQPLWR